MKNTILLPILTVFTSLLLAQSGNSILMNSFCISEDFTLSYASASGSPSRNVYEGIGNSFNEVRVIWSSTNNRWEIWAGEDDGITNYTIFLFSNTYASAPNPPDKDTGTWVNQGDCTDPLVTFSGNGTQSSLALAVELLSFAGKRDESGILLSWATASEYDNQGFEVERSADGTRFEKIGFVSGTGTITQMKSYTFTDLRPNQGVSYYRLKQLDDAGAGYAYSNIIKIAQSEKNTVSIFPNPGNGFFTITGLKDIQNEQFTVCNMLGQALSVSPSDNGKLDLSSFPSGVYYLNVTSSGQIVKVSKK